MKLNVFSHHDRDHGKHSNAELIFFRYSDHKDPNENESVE